MEKEFSRNLTTHLIFKWLNKEITNIWWLLENFSLFMNMKKYFRQDGEVFLSACHNVFVSSHRPHVFFSNFQMFFGWIKYKNLYFNLTQFVEWLCSENPNTSLSNVVLYWYLFWQLLHHTKAFFEIYIWADGCIFDKMNVWRFTTLWPMLFGQRMISK